MSRLTILLLAFVVSAGCVERMSASGSPVDHGLPDDDNVWQLEAQGGAALEIRVSGPIHSIDLVAFAPESGSAAGFLLTLSTARSTVSNVLVAMEVPQSGIHVQRGAHNLSIDLPEDTGSPSTWMRFHEFDPVLWNQSLLVTLVAANAHGSLPFALWVNGSDVAIEAINLGPAWMERPQVGEGTGATARVPDSWLGAAVAHRYTHSWVTTAGTVFALSGGLLAAGAYEKYAVENADGERWQVHGISAYGIPLDLMSEKYPAITVGISRSTAWSAEIDFRATAGAMEHLLLVADIDIPEPFARGRSILV